RYPALRAEFHEVSALEGRFREQHTVVGNNADGDAMEMRKAADQRRPIACLEFIEARAVDDTGNDFAHIVGHAQVGRDDTCDFRGIEQWRLTRWALAAARLGSIEIGDSAPRERQRMRVIARKMVRDAGEPCVHVATAEILRRNDLAGRGLDQRWASEKDRPLP